MPSACASSFWMELMSMGLQQRAPRMGSIQHFASCICASAYVAWVVQAMRRRLRTRRKWMLSSTERGKRGVSSFCIDFGWAHTSSLGTCCNTVSPLPHGVTNPVLGAGSVRCLSCVTLTDCLDRAGPRRGGLSLSAHRARAALCASAARQLAGALQSISAHSVLYCHRGHSQAFKYCHRVHSQVLGCCHRVHSQVCTLPCIIVAPYGRFLKKEGVQHAQWSSVHSKREAFKEFSKAYFCLILPVKPKCGLRSCKDNFTTWLYRNRIIGVQIVACSYVLH